jgi:hypothetical protein
MTAIILVLTGIASTGTGLALASVCMQATLRLVDRIGKPALVHVEPPAARPHNVIELHREDERVSRAA